MNNFLDLTDGIEVDKVLRFETIVCANCGCPFCIPSGLRKELQESHKSFFCPNGHSLSYTGKSEKEKLKEELDLKKKELEDSQHRNIFLRGEKEKIEKKLKRVNKGVCPCCTRSFMNLKRHMETKHADLLKKSE